MNMSQIFQWLDNLVLVDWIILAAVAASLLVIAIEAIDCAIEHRRWAKRQATHVDDLDRERLGLTLREKAKRDRR